MANLTEILDELAWVASPNATLDAETIADLLEKLEALGAFPKEQLPEGLDEILGDVIELAREAASDERHFGALRNALNIAFSTDGFVSLVAQQPENEGPDDDILQIFLGSADDNLGDLERALLSMENDDPEISEADAIEDAKRVMHTLKGECGVLSLHTAQELWHEAENMIHALQRMEVSVPVDPLMDLLDWQRAFVDQIRNTGSIDAPAHDEILARMRSLTKDPRAVESPGENPAENASNGSARDVELSSTEEGDEGLDDDSELVEFSEEILADETIPEFITEAQAHLEDSEAALLDLESNPSSNDSIDRVFRAFHTIKGVAGFLELGPVTRVAHSAETLLDRFRQDNIEFTAGHADIVLESKDMLARLMDALSGSPGPSVNSLNRLIERIEQVAADPSSAARLGSRALKATLSDVGFAGEAGITEAIKDPAKATQRLGYLLLARGQIEQTQLDEALRLQESLANGGTPMRLGELLVRFGAITEEQLEDTLGLQGRQSPLGQLLESTISNEHREQPTPPPAAAQTAPSSGRAPKPPEASTSDASSVPSDAEIPAAPPARKAPSPPASPKKKANVDTTIRVNTQRLDALVDMVGELVIAQQMVVQGAAPVMAAADESLGRNLAHLGKITRDLQEASMSLRMVTFRSTFQKMHRLVRDVASKASKKVRLVVEGADTEVDRNVVDKISDPLVHLVRNAIDHGLEDPEGRTQAGKSAEGIVTLSARHQGGAIVISLQDDGRGLSREKILAKATERGLIPKGTDPSELSESATNRLIFEPGFSTAAQVTDISGRGVGMDVVKRNIEAMRGKIEIESREGHGTTFQIHLPLTLAIIDAMVVRSGEDRYVIPTLSIVQSFQPETGQIHRIKSSTNLVEVRGELVPICGLNSAVGGLGSYGDPSNSTLILVEAIDRRACLVVDEIIGQQQVVIKKLGDCMPTLPVVSGGAILGDGRVALIVDIEGILGQIDIAVPA